MLLLKVNSSPQNKNNSHIYLNKSIFWLRIVNENNTNKDKTISSSTLIWNKNE